MAERSIELKVDGINELRKQLGDLPASMRKSIMRGAMRSMVGALRKSVRDAIPRRSGKLRSTARVSVRQQTQGMTMRYIGQVIVGGRDAPHAHLAQLGTKPHEIKPRGTRGKRGLKIAVDGGVIVRRRVQHPGAKGVDFMEIGLRKGQAEAERRFEDYIKARISEALK